jgi:hypothetical protein
LPAIALPQLKKAKYDPNQRKLRSFILLVFRSFKLCSIYLRSFINSAGRFCNQSSAELEVFLVTKLLHLYPQSSIAPSVSEVDVAK